MSKKKQLRCGLAAATVSLCFCLLLGGASWLAVTSVSKDWLAPDYWLTWFSVFTLAGSVASAVMFGAALSSALDCAAEE